MLAILKFVNGIMSLIEFFGGMYRDEQLKQDGRNEVAAKNAGRLIKARNKAHAKIQSFDDAIAAARGKLPIQHSDDK